MWIYNFFKCSKINKRKGEGERMSQCCNNIPLAHVETITIHWYEDGSSKEVIHFLTYKCKVCGTHIKMNMLEKEIWDLYAKEGEI